MLLQNFKWVLTQIGASASEELLTQLQAGVNYMRIGKWMRDHSFTFPKRERNREEVWNAILKDIAEEPVLYLEFGVFEGDATRFWAKKLKHPCAILHGFDSFEGMPETAGAWDKGEFDTEGTIPVIDDSRVKFFKGWFDQVLPTYEVPRHTRLVLNLDADLYSSTRYVLTHLAQHIRPGTYIYFDEMNHIEHEPKAFTEFMKHTNRRFEPVAADKSLAFVAFRCVA